MQKIHKRLPQILGGYWRKLKRKNPLKGFTLVELIVVIVILAILAAILIPGLLKWIDQAKDKKYELEAREIALAAEAAMTKVYAAGSVEVKANHYQGSLVHGSESDFMKLGAFKQEIEKLTDADIKRINLHMTAWNSSDYGNYERPWDGSISGFYMYFVSSDGTKIYAYCNTTPDIKWGTDTHHFSTNGWVIQKNPNYWPS